MSTMAQSMKKTPVSLSRLNFMSKQGLLKNIICTPKSTIINQRAGFHFNDSSNGLRPSFIIREKNR